MKRFLVLLVLVLPSASADEYYEVRCNATYCLVPTPMFSRLMKAYELVDQAAALCGWSKK